MMIFRVRQWFRDRWFGLMCVLRPSRYMNCETPIHDWFGLSYASYLVIPRAVIEQMPTGWQKHFVWMLDLADKELLDIPYVRYRIQAVDESTGRIIRDPMAEYRHPARLRRRKDGR